MKHVIIGAGAAGITAAKTIRKLQPLDEIVLISEDKHITSRCLLHKYVSGERDVDKLSFVPPNFFDDNRIEWQSGARVTGIDTVAQTVYCGDAGASYDKLLIATGAEGVFPPIAALSTAANVFGFRHFSDAQAIRQAALLARRIVVTGAGLAGLDAAYALLRMKKDVTVVESFPHIMALNLDKRAAEAYQDRFETAGCKFCFGRKVTDASLSNTGNIVQVVLDDGSLIPCGLMVLAAGVRPAAGFLKGSNIACNGAITVDSYLATSCPNVYAAGDVSGLSGTWPNAKHQGKIAAMNMCGEAKTYDDSFAAKNVVNFFGLATISVGLLMPEEGDRMEVREDSKIYQKFIIRKGRVAGVILQGDISNSGFWQYVVKNGVLVDKMNKPLWKLSFADFCLLDEEGRYSWQVTG